MKSRPLFAGVVGALVFELVHEIPSILSVFWYWMVIGIGTPGVRLLGLLRGGIVVLAFG